ncbi:MAG: hypothetical protein ACT4QD_21465, partial [Acidobacteriota bacterium]
MLNPATRRTRRALGLCTLVLAVAAAGLPLQAQKPEAAAAPNYTLAAQWTSQKVSKLVFGTTVTPRWLETSDRFWYAYQTREGRRFVLVDPVKKSKAPLFDHARMVARLTTITRIPYDAQHLPFSTVRFVKNDTAFQFDVTVPADATLATPPRRETTDQNGGQNGGAASQRPPGPGDDGSLDPQQRTQSGAAAPQTRRRTRTLRFEYDLARAEVALIDDQANDPRQPRWASLSPDGRTVVFARNHNLFMMDADNYGKAQKSAADSSIVEVQLTTDGEEHYSYARSAREIQQLREQEQQQQREEQERDGTVGTQQETEEDSDDPNARTPAITIIWSRDSNKFALIRRDQRKVADLWVINTLATPRPTLETYRYAMPGEKHVTQSEMHVF